MQSDFLDGGTPLNESKGNKPTPRHWAALVTALAIFAFITACNTKAGREPGTYYVSSTGSDSNPGTRFHEWVYVRQPESLCIPWGPNGEDPKFIHTGGSGANDYALLEGALQWEEMGT